CTDTAAPLIYALSLHDALPILLTKMQNKLEFGLKVLWDRDQAIREVENEDEDISRLKKEISGQKGPTYFARMQYGRLIDSALQADRKSTRLNSSHEWISYAVFC